MKRALILLALFAPTLASADPTAYRTKNTATRVCGTIMDATTAKRIGAAVTGIDCEYGQVLDGTSESAFADLATAEAVVGSVGQFCALVTASEINIDGDLRIHCSATNTNAADWIQTLTTRGGKVEASGILKTSFADDGQLTSESTVTYGLASGGITADNQNVGRALVVYSNSNRAIELARCCIASSANTGDTVTCSTDISASITGAGGSADYYTIADSAQCQTEAEDTAVPGVGTKSLGSMLRAIYQLMVNKFDSTASEQTWYRSDGTTVWSTKDISDNGTTYSRTAQETND